MEKQLPSVFANKIDKEIKNNKKVYYSGNSIDKEDLLDRGFKQRGNLSTTNKTNINQKIKDIFNSSKYVYKADVEIVLGDRKINKKIVGKNGNHLITIDNDLIPISEIKDINFTN